MPRSLGGSWTLRLALSRNLSAQKPEAARELYGRIGARYRRAMPRPSAGKGPPPRLDPKTAELLSRERVTLRLAIERVRSSGFG